MGLEHLENQIVAFSLANPELVSELGDISDDFERRHMADLWRKMASLYAEHGDVPLALLVGHPAFAPIGIGPWLDDNLLGLNVKVWPVKAWAETLRRERLKASAAIKLEQAMAIMSVPGMDATEAMLEARAALEEAGRRRTDRVQMLSEIMLSPEAAEGARVPTGYHTLDRMILGWEAGTLAVIAARPSVGKSAMGLCLLLEIARRGTPCGIVSSEMSSVQLRRRMTANISGVEHHALRSGRLRNEDIGPKMRAEAELSELPIAIGDIPDAVYSSVADVHRAAVNSSGSCPVVVVDYLQRLAPYSKLVREQVVADVAKGLRNQAKELNTCVVALAQRGRAADGGTTNRRPRLGDLRESAVIEQEADLVMFLWHETDEERMADISNVKLTIAKQRNGPLGDIDLVFHKPTQRIKERERWEGQH